MIPMAWYWGEERSATLKCGSITPEWGALGPFGEIPTAQMRKPKE
jgi:hypothetical protein